MNYVVTVLANMPLVTLKDYRISKYDFDPEKFTSDDRYQPKQPYCAISWDVFGICVSKLRLV